MIENIFTNIVVSDLIALDSQIRAVVPTKLDGLVYDEGTQVLKVIYTVAPDEAETAAILNIISS